MPISIASRIKQSLALERMKISVLLVYNRLSKRIVFGVLDNWI
jgi:hypothetical protein